MNHAAIDCLVDLAVRLCALGLTCRLALHLIDLWALNAKRKIWARCDAKIAAHLMRSEEGAAVTDAADQLTDAGRERR